MSKLAKNLSEAERINIALYYSQYSVKPRKVLAEASPAGEKIYKSTCYVCHGVDGKGSHTFPRIAGQPAKFLETALLHFLANDETRKDSPMMAIVRNLNEQQIKDVAAYVSRMQSE